MGRKDDASRPPSSRVAGRDGRIESRDAFVVDGEAFVIPPEALVADSEAFVVLPEALVADSEAFVVPPGAFVVDSEAFVEPGEAFVVDSEAFVVPPEALVADSEAFVVLPEAFFAASEAFIEPREAFVAARDALVETFDAFVEPHDAFFEPRDAFLAASAAGGALEDDLPKSRDAFLTADDALLVNRFERTKPIVELAVQNTKSIQKSYVAFKLPSSIAALVVYVQGILAAMTSNAHFPSPAPALTAIAAALTALQQAEVAAQTRAKGAVVVRNDRRGALVTLLQQLRGYVQTIADADVENSAAIIESSGFPLRRAPVHKPRIAGVKPGEMSGSVEVVAPTAGRRAAYEWQYSVDGGKTWVEASPSLQAKQTVVGLPVGSTALFRYRAVVKTGPLDWSQPLALLVK